MHKLIPVTVLSEFLGSGKTTLLKNILENRAGLKGLQPTAEYIETNWGKVDIDRVINTGLFSMGKAENSPLWMRELQSGGHKNHTPETEEYGISSFIYRRNRPFHPERYFNIELTKCGA